MLTNVERHMAKEAAREELAKLLAVAREEGYLERCPDEPGPALMTRVIMALEKVEKESPGSLASRTPPRVVPALRRVAALCAEAARREASRGLTASLGAVAGRR